MLDRIEHAAQRRQLAGTIRWLQHPTVTDELSERLLEALGAPALVELTAWVALANQYARTNVALGIEAQGFSASCGLAPLAQPSGVASQA